MSSQISSEEAAFTISSDGVDDIVHFGSLTGYVRQGQLELDVKLPEFYSNDTSRKLADVQAQLCDIVELQLLIGMDFGCDNIRLLTMPVEVLVSFLSHDVLVECLLAIDRELRSSARHKLKEEVLV